MKARPPSCVEGIDRVDLRVFQDVRAWTIAHDIDAISGDDAVLDLYFAGSVKVEARPAVLVRLQLIKDGQRGISPSRPVRDESLPFVVMHYIAIEGVETVVARRAVGFEPEAGILRARRHVVDKVVPSVGDPEEGCLVVGRPDSDLLIPRQNPEVTDEVVVLLGPVLAYIAVTEGIVSDIVLDADLVGLMHHYASLIGVNDGIVPDDGAGDVTRHVKVDRLERSGSGVGEATVEQLMRREGGNE